MRRQGWWTRWSSGRQVLAAVLVLCAGLLQTAYTYDIRPGWGWLHSHGLLFWSYTAAGTMVLVNSVSTVISDRREVAGEARRLDIHKAVIATLVALAGETATKITDLGANVFLVSSPWRRRVRLGRRVLSIGREPRLERIERIRLADYPSMSAVTWTEGKGVIGAAWANERPEHVNWSPLASRWDGVNITDAEWDSIDDHSKAGFSRADFIAMVGKYAEIIAVPIKDEQGTTIGVIAIDRVWRREATQTPVLDTASVEEAVTSAAAVLQNVLRAR